MKPFQRFLSIPIPSVPNSVYAISFFFFLLNFTFFSHRHVHELYRWRILLHCHIFESIAFFFLRWPGQWFTFRFLDPIANSEFVSWEKRVFTHVMHRDPTSQEPPGEPSSRLPFLTPPPPSAAADWSSSRYLTGTEPIRPACPEGRDWDRDTSVWCELSLGGGVGKTALSLGAVRQTSFLGSWDPSGDLFITQIRFSS